MTGNMYLDQTDITIPTVGQDLKFVRSYNTQDLADPQHGVFGRGWNHAYEQRLGFPATGIIMLRKGDGMPTYFKVRADNVTYDSIVPFTLSSLIVKQGDGSYVRTFRVGGSESYESERMIDGVLTARLTGLVDSRGNATTLTRDASGRLMTITDVGSGRALSLHYIATQTHPDTLKGPANTLIATYTYYAASGLLQTVTYPTTPDPTGYTFTYESSTNRLLTVADLSGRTLETHTYDGTGRAFTSEISAGQERYTFDYSKNLQTKVTDALGNDTFYDYTNIWGMKFVTKITGTCSACGGGNQVQTWTYDDKGRTKSYTDGNGNVTNYDYDPSTGDLVSMTEAVGTPQQRTTTYTNDPATGLRSSRTVPSVVNPGQNKVTSYTYENGQLKTLTETGLLGDASPYSYVTTYGYNSAGKLSSIDGPRTDVADVTTFDHDSVTGDLTSVTVPLAGATTYSDFTPFGQAQTVTDPNGVATTYTYDPRMRVATMTIAGDSTTYHYGAAGKLKQIDLPRGNSIFYDPDPYDRLEKIRDHLGNYIKYTYDLMSQRTKEEIFDVGNVLQKTLSFEYDGLRRLKKVINPDATFTQYDYDGAGNRKSVKNPRDFTTTYDYDALNRQFDAIQPGTITTGYGYDTHDGLSSITDPNGYVTTHHHDDMGRVYQEISPDTGTTNYSYDPAGNRTSKTDARGIAVSYSYDALNRLTLVNFPSDPDITYTYDVPCTNGRGRLCQLVDQAGTTTYSYTVKGQLSQEIKTVLGVQYVTAYPGYDSNGNLTFLTYPSGRTVTYGYDMVDRVSSVSATPSGGSPQTLASDIQYKPFGGMSAFTYGNGIGRTVGYDQQYRISSIQSGSVQNLTYGPDANGNILTWNNLVDPSKNKTLGYDALDRLGSAAGSWGSLSWTYDGVGNRLTQTAPEGSSAYTYQSGTNRLASATGPSPLTFGYDNNGNITTYSNKLQIYDENNRLASSAVNLGVQIKTVAYAHYASGQRAWRTGGTTLFSGSTVFHYDQAGQLIAETLDDGTFVTDYVHLNGQPLAKAAGATVTYIHPDHLGSPALMTNSAGTNVWAIEQRPFGDGPTITGSATLNLRFPGQYFDTQTDLHENWWREYNPTIGRYNQADPLGVGYYRARYYDPKIGRFISEDPIRFRGGINFYAYVANNPVNRVDPSGLQACCSGGGWEAGAACYERCVNKFLLNPFLFAAGTVAAQAASTFGNAASGAGQMTNAEFAGATTSTYIGSQLGLINSIEKALQFARGGAATGAAASTFASGAAAVGGIVGSGVVLGCALACSIDACTY